MSQTIICGDSAKELKKFTDNSIDAVITDPPYGIEFLAKEWDSNTGAVEIWSECLRVLKPGGHLLAFSAARTYHQLATNIESVGFEVRDQIMWLYASGFPKGQDIGKSIQRRQGVKETKAYKQNVPRNGGDGDTKHYENTGEVVPTCEEAVKWTGWKTQLKPAHEPIVMARKPMKTSTIDNVLAHGVGALNIDATRIGERFPSNVVGEVEGYQKFFYCPKVSREERHRGFEQTGIPTNKGRMLDRPTDGSEWVLSQHRDEKARTQANVSNNNHPTVKPVELMKYLIELVAPPGSHIMDPFAGSGTTGMAAKELGYTFTGIEMDHAYCEIAKQRIAATTQELT